MSKFTPLKILAVLGIAFAGYLTFSSFMDWPWGRSLEEEYSYLCEEIGGKAVISKESYCSVKDSISMNDYYLARAQDACAAEGGEWGNTELITIPGYCSINEETFSYQNHTLEGFDEYKALKNAKEVCSRAKGEWMEERVTIERDITVSTSTYQEIQIGCKTNNKLYNLKDGRLLREDELK